MSRKKAGNCERQPPLRKMTGEGYRLAGEGRWFEVSQRKVVVVVVVEEFQRDGFKDLDGGKGRKVKTVLANFYYFCVPENLVGWLN